MLNFFKNLLREARLWKKIFSRSANALGFRCRIQSLYYLSNHYNFNSIYCMRPIFMMCHDFVAQRESNLIRYSCIVADTQVVIMLRNKNAGDYCIAGELTDGIYSAPNFTPAEIYDCGANIGAFSIFASKTFPSAAITCFEPDADNVALLKINLGLNGIIADIKYSGVWNKKGTLYYHPASSITGLVSDEKSDYPIFVESLILSSPLAWVKLDVEGAEYVVIPDLLSRLPLPKSLSIELHFFNAKGRPIIKLLERNNYKLSGYIDDSLECVVFNASLDCETV